MISDALERWPAQVRRRCDADDDWKVRRVVAELRLAARIGSAVGRAEVAAVVDEVAWNHNAAHLSLDDAAPL